MPAMEELNERFRADRFAAQAGVEIREAEPGRALCAMPLRPCHMNANGHLHPGGFCLRGGVQRVYRQDHRLSAGGHHLSCSRQRDGAAGGGKVPEIRADHLPLCGGRAGRAGDLCGPRHGEWIYGKIRIFSSFGEPDGGALRLNG